jgi:O-antigen/teichoic acid export membrane protein
VSEARSGGDLTAAATHGVRWISLARIATELLLVGSMVVLARLIPPEDFGRFAIAVIVQELAMSLPTEGVGSALVQRDVVLKEHLAAGAFLTLVGSFALLGLTLLLAGLLVAPVFGSQTADLVRLSAPMFVIAGFGATPIAILRRRLDFRSLSIMDISAAVVRALTSVALAALAGLNGSALVIGALAGTGIASLVAFASAPSPMPRFRRWAVRDLAGYGGPASAASVAWIGFRNGDYAVVAARLGAASAGIYWRAFQLAVEYQRKISVVMYTVAFPVLSRSATAEEMHALRSRMVRLLTVVIFPLLAGLCVTGPVVIPFVFGQQWAPAVVPTQILCGAGAATLVIDAVGTSLMASGRPRALLGYGVAHFVVYVGTVLLVAPLGLVAVAVAAVSVHTAFLLIAYTLLHPGHHRSALRFLWNDAGAASVSCLALAAAVGLASLGTSAADVGGLSRVVLLVAVGGVAYIATLRALFPDAAADLAKLAHRTVLGSLGKLAINRRRRADAAASLGLEGGA